ncbi:hypothetical protein ACFPOI_55530 [Nonomuraea angiospora]|uniref:Uncharacterized protein n=1 Tax=Nonomuraea angiospora TaxID=46172 RepID=A0ABR9M7G5_9ACTN|nr:hypothetical protein [Nonomuraea angiospora]MBE1588829.1 hypothetical protein [Nonomuraea angiospora]
MSDALVVQCVTSVAETRELPALADENPLIGAVVGWADLTSPAIGDVLAATATTFYGLTSAGGRTAPCS